MSVGCGLDVGDPLWELERRENEEEEEKEKGSGGGLGMAAERGGWPRVSVVVAGASRKREGEWFVSGSDNDGGWCWWMVCLYTGGETYASEEQEEEKEDRGHA